MGAAWRLKPAALSIATMGDDRACPAVNFSSPKFQPLNGRGQHHLEMYTVF
jgi:hypothetical protein